MQARGASAAAPALPAEDRYEKLAKLGEGTYGIVFQARDRETGEIVALKKIRADSWNEGVPATAMREISVLKEIQHPNIVRLKNVFISQHGNPYLVFELLERDLKQYMDMFRGRGMELKQAKTFLYQMLCGIEACHAHRIIHRDIKPQNVLIDGDELKIADFGLARSYSIPLKQYTHEVVTLWYRAPEILLGSKIYSTSLDLWSIGCIYLEMLNGKPLFAGDSEIDELYKVFQVLGTPTEAVWPGVTSMPDFSPSFPHWPPMLWSRICPQLDEHGVDLMRSMLCYDPARRITARTACQHPYFKDLVARRTGSSASAPPGSSPAAPAAPAAAASASAAAGAAGMYPADTAPSGDGGGSAGVTPLHMSDA